MPAQQARRQQQASVCHRLGRSRYGKAGALQRHGIHCAPNFMEGIAEASCTVVCPGVLKVWLHPHAGSAQLDMHHLHAPRSCG